MESGWFLDVSLLLTEDLVAHDCNTVSWAVQRHSTQHCVPLHVQWNKTGSASITYRFSLMETKWLERLKADAKNPFDFTSHRKSEAASFLNSVQRSRTLTHPVTDAGVCVCIVLPSLLWHSAPLQPNRMRVNSPGPSLERVGHCDGIHIKGQLSAEVDGAADKDTRFWAAEHHGANGPDTGC